MVGIEKCKLIMIIMIMKPLTTIVDYNSIDIY